MCRHGTPWPHVTSDTGELAAAVSAHPEQGLNLLCNGVILFDDDRELLPDGRAVRHHHTWLRPELASR
ncbi:DUF5999 family protein [Geodermatophilus sp. DSM 44513]|uniref:DUF5999 family protein n=1 Tax=Geodermatophilus sp. DSM 44513 TaxID=1528104 RepID=UPI0014133FE5|nr:DUF5999 family protein [Geodermatophilus sp. DSM 44513]WNV75213.1 DUF5999 family protein [Geodermatophilus sp. DSM 44513]